MLRYRMSTPKPRRFGWVVLLLFIGLLLIILISQPKGSTDATAPLAPATENSAGSGLGGTALQLWNTVKTGVIGLWSKLTGQSEAKQVSFSLDDASVAGSGDDDDVNMSSDVSVAIADPVSPEAMVPAGSSPEILIYQTHSYESYDKQDGQDYVETAQWRTKNNNFNVDKVGEELAQTLSTKYGIGVLHDNTDNECSQLGTAYTRSLATVQKDLAANPNLKILIDLHRDANNASINPSTVTIDGKQVARIMIVIGTGVGQTGVGFTIKPDWKKNLAVAQAITDKLNQFDPQLARKVDIKTGRYNQHLSPGAILIEVGHNENTLEEALNAVPYLAQAVAAVYDSIGDNGTLTAAGTVSPSPSASAAAPATSAAVQPSASTTGTPQPSPTPSIPVQQVISIEPVDTPKPSAANTY